MSALKRIVPLFDRVLVQRAAVVPKSAGGILLPETSKKLNSGTVVAVGSGARTQDGAVVPMTVAAGDKVLLPEFGGTTVKLEQEEYVMYHENELLAKLSE